MNLAGNQAKQLFKALRTGGRPPTVALWAAATVVDQIRKRQRPERELLASKKLKPGESYVIRVPGPGEAPLASTIGNGTVASVAAGTDRSITSELFEAATDLIGAASQPPEETEASPTLSRRQRRKAEQSTDPEPEPTIASTLVDVAASFMNGGDLEEEPEEAGAPTQLSRRKRRRAGRVASLDEFDVDRQALSRRRRRKLKRAEKRARRRPSRRRMRKARHQQDRATAFTQPSRRRRRRLRAAEREVEYRAAKVEKRSTRRRRRKLRKAEKALDRLTR